MFFTEGGRVRWQRGVFVYFWGRGLLFGSWGEIASNPFKELRGFRIMQY